MGEAADGAASDGPVLIIVPMNHPEDRATIRGLIARLVTLRKQRGYTQPDMAKMLGSHLGRLRSFENGDTDPAQVRLESVLRYARAIGATVTFDIDTATDTATDTASDIASDWPSVQ